MGRDDHWSLSGVLSYHKALFYHIYDFSYIRTNVYLDWTVFEEIERIVSKLCICIRIPILAG